MTYLLHGKNMLKNNFNYLKYLFKHKSYVLRHRKLFDVPFIQALVHDWTKFLPSEWFAYIDHFYGDTDELSSQAFMYAWNAHQKYNKHHWEHWVLINEVDSFERDGPPFDLLPIPIKYVNEMVLDWFCAGLVINGKVDLNAWFDEMKYKMEINDETMEVIEDLVRSKAHLEGQVMKSRCNLLLISFLQKLKGSYYLSRMLTICSLKWLTDVQLRFLVKKDLLSRIFKP